MHLRKAKAAAHRLPLKSKQALNACCYLVPSVSNLEWYHAELSCSHPSLAAYQQLPTLPMPQLGQPYSEILA